MPSVVRLLALLPVAYAFQLPFSLPFLTKAPAPSPAAPLPAAPPRIAIVGAGPSGSSAAFWLSKAQERFGLDIQVDIYDINSYVGGRSTVAYPYDDPSLTAVELGASIFIEANKNLWRASNEFNLTRSAFKSDDAAGFGLWDGSDVYFEMSNSWWDYPKLLWRYGLLSPKRADKITDDMVKSYLTLYRPNPPRWDNIADLAHDLNFTELLTHSVSEYMLSKGVSATFTNELIEAATRVNYGQNVLSLHALDGLASLAANNVVSIENGNYQIFEQFVERSAASLYLDTAVTKIVPSSSAPHHWDVHHQRNDNATAANVTTYKAVILALPMHTTSKTTPILPPSVKFDYDLPDYVNLHVTLLTTTTESVNATFLSRHRSPSTGRKSLPKSIYATNMNSTELEFNSISYLYPITREGQAKEWVVKIFSLAPLTDDWLNAAFDNQVGWVLRKIWDAYPIAVPTDKFGPVKLDSGLYYVNSFETFISTMETMTVASRNVVDLMLNDDFGGAGVCRRSLVASTPDVKAEVLLSTARPSTPASTLDEKDFVFGWDC